MVGTMFKILALAAATLQFVAASPAPALVTIVAPAELGGESTALSGVIAGVNSLSQTTYIVSESTVVDSTPVAATVTVVEGSDYMSYTAVLAAASTSLAVGGACTLKDGTAICTEADSDGTVTTETLKHPGSWILDVPTSTPKNSAQRTGTSIVGALVGLTMAYYLV
ncbi:hypothetical protein FB451DRAFT_1268703 [Mycena latifolia]|nr:hypothetical protein FB451DRAFT_1268703 [Mycena latifolia]